MPTWSQSAGWWSPGQAWETHFLWIIDWGAHSSTAHANTTSYSNICPLENTSFHGPYPPQTSRTSLEKVDVGSACLLNLVETLWFSMLSDSPTAVSTEYVGAKPSSRISHNMQLFFGLFSKPDFIANQPKGQPAVSPFLAFKRNARNKFLQILASTAALRNHNWTGVGLLSSVFSAYNAVTWGMLHKCGTKPTVVTFPYETMCWPLYFFQLVHSLNMHWRIRHEITIFWCREGNSVDAAIFFWAFTIELTAIGPPFISQILKRKKRF